MDAVRDLDDPLTMVHLFATLPAEKLHGIPAKVVQTSRRLALEWQVWRLVTALRVPLLLVLYQFTPYGYFRPLAHHTFATRGRCRPLKRAYLLLVLYQAIQCVCCKPMLSQR